MLSLLVSLLIFALIAGLLYWVITLIPLPPPFKQIVLVIFAVLVVIYLIWLLMGIAPVHFYRE